MKAIRKIMALFYNNAYSGTMQLHLQPKRERNGLRNGETTE